MIHRLGIERPHEIRVEAIAEHCGATVLYRPLSGAEARIIGYRDRAIITVNSRGSVLRRRFSAAHELGHWMFDRGAVSFGCTVREFIARWSRLHPEVRANRFAAELLMPTSMFTESARGREMTFATVSDLARRYRTSTTATALRLVDCGSYPAILLCSRQGRRQWFRRAPSVPPELWPRVEIAPEALGEKGEVDADQWIDHPRSAEYRVHADTVRVGREFALTLIWWKDERQLLDLDPIDVNF